MDLAGLTLGIGRHVYYLSHYDAVFATKLDWLCQAFAISSVIMGKISVAFLILRLSIVKWHYYFLHTINVTLLLFTIPMVILDYAQCRPAALLWDPTLPGICQDSKMQGSFALFLGCKLVAHAVGMTKTSQHTAPQQICYTLFFLSLSFGPCRCLESASFGWQASCA